jgi:hypothetical protein
MRTWLSKAYVASVRGSGDVPGTIGGPRGAALMVGEATCARTTDRAAESTAATANISSVRMVSRRTSAGRDEGHASFQEAWREVWAREAESRQSLGVTYARPSS